MTQAAQVPVASSSSSVAILRTLGTIAMFSGLSIVVAYQFSDPIIKEQERLALEKAAFEVIPGLAQETASSVNFALSTGGLVRLDKGASGEANLFAVYDSSGELAGIALQGAAQGYSDLVHTLYGYDPDCECIVGLTITKSTDTPGMGDKKTVEGNKGFMANFKDLSVALTDDKGSLAHPIATVKHGTKTKPWEVDAISGATISSRAIGNGLRASTAELVPLIARHLTEIESTPRTGTVPATEAVSEKEVIK